MDYLAVNKKAWDKNTQVHVESKFYDVQGFIEGKSSLNDIELSLLGDVSGKNLLHLQCHFGQDTLSWARLGAKVTGVDLSSKAIEQAQKLADTLDLTATFVNEDVYNFGKNNIKQFDVVYSSYGAICWLPDLNFWAQIVADSLIKGGQVYLIEFHPFNDLFSGHSYFPSITPDIDEEGTYTENCPGEKSTMVTWPHSLAEVITALLKAGISIDDFQEYPYSPYDCFSGLEFVEGKGYQMLSNSQQVPLVYSIKGTKS